ncbi:hypothetical protein [Microvirga calopogonii]|uniref:hypothetical protein n=1 Tax=Microvirga calopogonii TaxID=2078013 RepID=UPI0013B3E850|nr:hypothetical protein [Microvirga calopogonii]
MNSSLRSFAQALDAWASDSKAVIVESAAYVSVSQLAASRALEIVAFANELSWELEIEDASQSLCEAAHISEVYEPYRITFGKPVAEGTLSLLTNTAFRTHLEGDGQETVWKIARLGERFDTLTRRYTHWSDDEAFEPLDRPKSPREIVRESNVPTIPSDLGVLILRDPLSAPFDDASFTVWATRAHVVCIRSLASEIGTDGSLLFRGPASVRMEVVVSEFSSFERDIFRDVQRAVRWVFENPKETEMRHGLFAAEIARVAGSRRNASDVFKRATRAALESAQIAYRLGLAELNRDALKAVVELRKAVSDETGKLLDSTRQLIAALSSAVFAGIGLYAARMITSTPGYILIILGVILSLYVFGVAWSGFSFMKIQRSLRNDWRNRSYTFLTDTEYQTMVTDPIARAEKGFKTAVWISAAITVALFSAALFSPLQGTPRDQTTPTETQKTP